jgi:Uma2 family endonuclease
MATSESVPIDEYLRTSYEPDREYVDGELVERHVGEYFHSRLLALILVLLMSRERERRFRSFPELRVEVRQRRRYRIPDICVKALPHEITSVLVKPDLAIEILSPDDEPGETMARVSDYLHAGTSAVWTIDPYKRRVFVDDHNGTREVENLIVSMDLVGSVDFNELFRQLDEPAA